MIRLRLGELEDIDSVLALHHQNQVDSMNADDKQDGFITTTFTRASLAKLINDEQGLFVATQTIDDGSEIVAYAMAASWTYWSQWPMFAHMLKSLSNLSYDGELLTTENSYQYGPVCVDKRVRGQGVFEKIFEYALKKMSARYSILLTFINQLNQRSYEAHVRKVKLDVIHQFEYNDNRYYELACRTQRDGST